LRSLDEISALLAIEPMMYFGIGFLASTLIAIAIIPLVHNRAARLATRRVTSLMPQSLTEIVTEKDSMRAKFAVAVRRLEIRIEELIQKDVAHAGQLKHQSSISKQLKEALDEKSNLIAALEVREGALIAREDYLIQELRALRDEKQRNQSLVGHEEKQRNRESIVPIRLPPAASPWK
jgi:lipopolysaccharide export LptBFGC system permease protein LptF